MNKRILKAAIFFIAITVTGLFACKEKSTVLNFTIKKDKEYIYSINWDMKQSVYGQESIIGINSVYSIKMTEDDGKIKTLKGTYKSIKMNMPMLGQTINIDTDKPAKVVSETDMEKNPLVMMEKIFSGIIDKSFNMKVDENGKIIEVTGFMEIYESMLGAINLDEAKKAEAITTLKSQFNEKSIQDQFAQIFILFPNKEIKPGDTWEKEYLSAGSLPLKYTTTFSVKEIEGNLVKIHSNTKIRSTAEMAIFGAQNGNMIVDSKSGLIVNAHYEQRVESTLRGMTVTMEGKGGVKGELK